MAPVDEYLATLPAAERTELERVRDAVLSAVPDVEQGRSYGVPALMHAGKPLLGFHAGKGFLSVYPYSSKAVDAARPYLDGYEVSSGTVRFSAKHPLPDPALAALLTARLDEIK
jgi:uncharacterized protein YdhG (YjbR/CyaY superfamily)